MLFQLFISFGGFVFLLDSFRVAIGRVAGFMFFSGWYFSGGPFL
ncbi:hypothetical protein PDR5_46270 [Pseudomonas sp. DR 5-09]|nr:hypothetical protein PDR5_46270 [Pseudomonas sp. DR 5-09]